jgi:hypothetical protein
MAEVLGVVASGLTIAQIAGQIISSAQQFQALSRYVRNVPENLRSTLDEIEMAAQLFAEVKAFDESAFPGQGSLLQNYLLKCQAASSSLQELVTNIVRPFQKKSKFRAKYLIKAVLKKDEIEELKAKLDSTKASLQMAMTYYSLWGFSLDEIQLAMRS